ncbi:MAG: ribose-phosphate pyrophosphokinase [Bacillota bacterium]|nr:ribose-phosphate pyrophosphokinase [Bacillota bacterium]
MKLNNPGRIPFGELGIIALESCKDLGDSVDLQLLERRGEGADGSERESYLITANEIRFSNGEGKVSLKETIRGKDIYILCDVGNYSCTYNLYGIQNHKGPDEHFQDIKRTVSALAGKARRITVIMPLLYESRQHKRKGRESLDCAIALQELEHLGVDSILTFDAHDPTVQNAIPLIGFESLYPTYDIIKTLIDAEKNLTINKSNMIVISPDTGAMDRAIYYSNMLGVDVGMFYKRRDYSKVVNGKNPIVQHEYIGSDVEGKDVLIVDDMIASGDSMLDIAKELKARNANNIYCAVTFGLFTEGTRKFDEYYQKGLIKKVYSTNLTYVSDDVKNAEWFKCVDMSHFIAEMIDMLNYDESIHPLVDATENTKRLVADCKVASDQV